MDEDDAVDDDNGDDSGDCVPRVVSSGRTMTKKRLSPWASLFYSWLITGQIVPTVHQDGAPRFIDTSDSRRLPHPPSIRKVRRQTRVLRLPVLAKMTRLLLPAIRTGTGPGIMAEEWISLR